MVFSAPKLELAESFLMYVSAKGERELNPESARSFGCKKFKHNRIGTKQLGCKKLQIRCKK
jgi:hypothetical protein